jgi:hypothetical protein
VTARIETRKFTMRYRGLYIVFLAVLTNGKKSDKTNTVATTTPASIDPLDQVSYVVTMIMKKALRNPFSVQIFMRLRSFFETCSYLVI